MVDKKIITFILIIFSAITYSQDFIYFNNRLDISQLGFNDQAMCLLECEDGNVFSGITKDTSNSWWHIVFSQIDQQGVLQNIKSFGDTISDYLSGYPGSIISWDNSKYYSVGSKRTPTLNGLYDQGMLMCLNSDFDTLWTRLFGEVAIPYDTTYLLFQLKKTYQNQLILIGTSKPLGLASKIYLLHIDSLGIKLWDHSYGDGYYYQGFSVIQISDSEYAIGGFKHLPGFSETADPIVIKTDSLGNQQWMKNLGGPFKDNKAMVCLALDGSIIAGTNYADEMLTPDISLSRINIIKLDNEGNEIWNKKYGPSVPHNYLLSIISLNDGSIVAAGTVYKIDPEPDRVGWIFKVTAEGDSIWYREYKNLLSSESRNYLYDVIQTNDTGLLACGNVLPFPPDTGSQDTWVIKLDSIGCDTAGCDPTVGIRTYEAQELKTILIYPNPASSEIYFQMSNFEFQISKYTFLSLYDVFGRKVEEVRIPVNQNQIQLDVSTYPPGVYIAILKNQNRVLGREKFVVQ